MKILVVEDEPLAAEELVEKLEKLQYEVTAVADSYETALSSVKMLKPDLVLVDIELGGKLTGIDLSEELNRMGIRFIYISSIEDLSIYYKARDTGPLEYLAKPVNNLSLRNALLQVKERAAVEKNRKMYFFPDRSGIKKRIEVDQIAYLEAQSMYCKVFFTDGTNWLLSVPMGNLFIDLDHADLVRIHNSFVINRNHLVKSNAAKVQLSTGATLPISRTYKNNFRASRDGKL